MSTIPAIGSEIEVRSKLIGAFSWLIATRNTTTITSFETISAITNATHFPTHPFVASHTVPDRAIGARTIPTRRSALRTRRENQTIAAAAMARKERKIVMIAPTPALAMLMVVSPMTSAPIFAPISSSVVPVAWTMPTQSWSTICSKVAVRVMTRNDPSTDFASPRAARWRAVASRRMTPVISCRKKKISMMKIAMPNRTL